MPTGKRYYVSVNFVCDTDGAEKDEPSIAQLDEAFRAMLKEAEKPNVSIEFEIWDEIDQEEMS
jgi:hypothetical protein